MYRTSPREQTDWQTHTAEDMTFATPLVGGKYVLVLDCQFTGFPDRVGTQKKTARFNSKYFQDVDVFVFNCKHNNQYFILRWSLYYVKRVLMQRHVSRLMTFIKYLFYGSKRNTDACDLKLKSDFYDIAMGLVHEICICALKWFRMLSWQQWVLCNIFMFLLTIGAQWPSCVRGQQVGIIV